MKLLPNSWKKAAAAAAAVMLLSSSAFVLSGCAPGQAKSAASSSVSAAAADSQMKPGVAYVKRDPSVPYSVPEGVSVLMYHMIGDIQNNAAVMTEANLRLQMNYLRDHGYHPITMQELYDYITKGAPLPEKPVCITFDDGYLDSYTIVYPLMKEYGFPWTLFLITDDVGKPYNRMTWDQLKEMADSHTVTIANHTLSHPKLHNLATAKEKEKEIVEANEALKYHLGIDNAWLAYPYGDYDDQVVEICKKAGIKMAVTTDSGRVHVGSYPYELKRVYVGNDISLARFSERLNKDNYTPV
ncbi:MULTISPECIES: polysaccharide deacetylase family protein [unclassified Dialister]|uniref:polysaccharide deacetylase family protein n=1 Tax=unclassified Dialister TaxID=2638756 RepID=UPI0025BD6A47|nr:MULTISPECIES: polysaccharide deacetylase family protein [unclassified Dialister]MEE0292704.1 polysaccharide deacetylase family protein [Dialister sp.]